MKEKLSIRSKMPTPAVTKHTIRKVNGPRVWYRLYVSATQSTDNPRKHPAAIMTAAPSMPTSSEVI
jgi:hypothetical protein